MLLMMRRLCYSFLALTAGASMALGQDIPKPKLKPDGLGQTTQDQASPKPKTLVWPKANGSWSRDVVTKERAACTRFLAEANMDFETLAPIGKPGGCGTPAPVLIRSIRGTRIEPPAEANCAFAEQLHGWVTSSLQPHAASVLGQKLVQIDNASAYVCRRRNNAFSGKLSEHAKANAFDIAQLRFDGDGQIAVKKDWSRIPVKSKKAKFLALIRRDACIRFTTVLGPGSDRHHGDHFHVDYARRKSGYRICK
jgi:hypothetical protein